MAESLLSVYVSPVQDVSTTTVWHLGWCGWMMVVEWWLIFIIWLFLFQKFSHPTMISRILLMKHDEGDWMVDISWWISQDSQWWVWWISPAPQSSASSLGRFLFESSRCWRNHGMIHKNSYGDFLSHRGTPVHHPFLVKVFHEINHPAIGDLHFRKPPYESRMIHCQHSFSGLSPGASSCGCQN